MLGLLFLVPITRAEGWVELSSSGPSGMRGVAAFDESSVVAVGYSGEIVYSDDGGTSWSDGSSGTTEDLNAVQAYSSSSAIAIGDGGVILQTTDNGATWSDISSSETTEDLYGLHMYDSSIGVIAEGTGKALVTDDAGATWTMYDTGKTVRLYDSFAATDTHFWAVGNSGSIMESTDAGATWNDVGSSGDIYRAIYFIDEDNGWIVGYGGSLPIVLQTTDAGATWSDVTPSDIDSSDKLYDIRFIDESEGLITTREGEVYKTVDGGSNWESVLSTGQQLHSVYIEDEDDQWVVGLSGGIYRLDAEGPEAPADFALASDTDDDTPSFSWTAAEDAWSDIDYYQIEWDAEGYEDIGDVTSYEFTDAVDDGTYSVVLRAVDEAGNEGEETGVTFTIDTSSSSSSDTTGPTVGVVWPTTVTTGTSTTFNVTVSDDVAVDNCHLWKDGSDFGLMTLSSSTAQLTTSINIDGTYAMYAVCEDTSGNSTTGSSVSVTVSSSASTDTQDPSVGNIAQTAATKGEELTLTASYADNVGVSSCELYVDDKFHGSMSLSSGTASMDKTFYSSGTKEVYMVCYDAAGNQGTSDETEIEVSDPTSSSSESGASSLPTDNLIKLGCSGGEALDHPCKAVYYYGDDGERHAFPNEKVYFTWYDDFDDVVQVTAEFMSSIPLGSNVTYHPGTRMVTFLTTHEVYAVSQGGVLRHVDGEDVAEALYGEEWSTFIDDISDAFYGNYSFGDDIDDADDYDVDEEQASVDSVSDNF